MKRKIFIGIDIGGTKIAAAIIRSDGTILAKDKKPTPPKAKANFIFRHLKEMVEKLICISNIDLNKIGGIGIGVPGIVKPNGKEILYTPNINLSRFPLAQKFEQTFKAEVLLGNDVNLGLLGEKWLGVGKNTDNIIGVFPGTGVGGAIIINGRLITGAQGAAGELGHMIMDWDSPIENAGVYGSLEALASRRAIEREIREAVKKGKKTVLTQWLHGQLEQIKSKTLAQALEHKDPVVTKVLNRVCTILGKTCISIRHIFNPDMIILGGGLIEACSDYILPKIRKISQADPFFKGVDKCRIVQSYLNDDAVMLGAVALLKQKFSDRGSSDTIIYPVLTSKSKNMSINNRINRRNFYVRADGKVKNLNGENVFTIVKRTRILAPGAIKKFCKKNPSLLILGSPKNTLKISSEGKQFLREKAIAFKTLPLAQAAQLYNASLSRKAIFILQKSTA